MRCEPSLLWPATARFCACWRNTRQLSAKMSDRLTMFTSINPKARLFVHISDLVAHSPIRKLVIIPVWLTTTCLGTLQGAQVIIRPMSLSMDACRVQSRLFVISRIPRPNTGIAPRFFTLQHPAPKTPNQTTRGNETDESLPLVSKSGLMSPSRSTAHSATPASAWHQHATASSTVSLRLSSSPGRRDLALSLA